jgi:predicted Zn finger-like uncharacterized protein
MRIECDNCGAKYSIADEKVAGKMIRLRCKKCGHNIRVDGTHLHLGDAGVDTGEGAADGAVWFVAIDGNQEGPLTAEQVQAMVQYGQVDADTFAWQEGMGDWARLADIPEFAAVFNGVIPPGGAEDDGDDYADESTRVVASPAEEQSAAAPAFSEAAYSAPLSRSFAPAPEPAPPAPLIENVAPRADAAGGAPSPAASSDSFVDQRRDNSVLFSLSDLTASRKPTARQEAVPRTEGSGLIDIRMLAGSAPAGTSGSGGAGPGEAPLGGLGPAPSTRAMVPIVPVPVRRSNTGLYVVLGVGGVIVVGLLVAIVVLLNQSPPPAPVPEPVAAAAPAPTPPAEPAAPEPAAEPTSEAVVVAVVPVEEEGSTAPPTAEGGEAPGVEGEQGTPQEVAARQAGEPVRARPQDAPREALPGQREAIAREEAAASPARAREPAPVEVPARTANRGERPASAASVIGNISGSQPATTPPARTPTPAARPAEGGGGASDVPSGLTRAEVQGTIRRYQSRVTGCNSGGASGTWRVRFRITPAGATEGVAVDNGDSVGNCLVGVVQSMTFPRNGGETPSITYPFTF